MIFFLQIELEESMHRIAILFVGLVGMCTNMQITTITGESSNPTDSSELKHTTNKQPSVWIWWWFWRCVCVRFKRKRGRTLPHAARVRMNSEHKRICNEGEDERVWTNEAANVLWFHVVRFGCSSRHMRPCKQNKNIWSYGTVGVEYIAHIRLCFVYETENHMQHATIAIRIALNADA